MASRTKMRMEIALDQLQRQLASSDTVLSNPSQVMSVEFKAVFDKLQGYFDVYCTDAEEYLKGIVDTTEYEKEARAHANVVGQVIDRKAELQVLMRQSGISGSGREPMDSWVRYGHTSYGSDPLDAVGSRSQISQTAVKLPKLEIGKYDGDPLKWLEFWDSFRSTIHERRGLSRVEKFKYLRSYLEGDAERFLEGYPLSDASYDTALDALRNRFGDLEKIKEAHISELLGIPSCGEKVQELRKTLDDCERHTRCLVALGLEEDQFGQFFAPILLSKFPYSVQVVINRHRYTDNEPWSLARLRSLLAGEISAREGVLKDFGKTKKMSSSLTASESDPETEVEHRVAAITMCVGATKTRKCVYCGGEHFHDECSVHTAVCARKARLKGRCFNCLSTRHKIKDCDSKRTCYYCHEVGHHRSLCFKKFPAFATSTGYTTKTTAQLNVNATAFIPSGNYHSSSGSSTRQGYLQTALADVAGSNDRVNARLLLDNGSTVTFITNRLAEKIGAKMIGREQASFSGFGKGSAEVDYPIYAFKLYLLDSSVSIDVLGMGVQHISDPIMRQVHDLTANPVLKQIPLADTMCTKDELVDLDLLIGGDYYYDIVGSETLRCSSGSCPALPISQPYNCPHRIDRCGNDRSCANGERCCDTGCYRECVTTRSAGVINNAPKPGICPTTSTRNFGTSCNQNCQSDQSCGGSQKCCYNGCGQECMFPVRGTAGNINTFSTSCSPNSCPHGQVCVVGSGTFRYECKLPKLGNCPSPSQVFSGTRCTNEFDPRCTSRQKCCSSSTGQQYCSNPVGTFGTFGTGGSTTTSNCRLYEEFRSYGPGCEATCEQQQSGVTRICTRPNQSGCFCIPGYVRQFEGGNCVPISSCGPTQVIGSGSNCGINQHYESCKRCEETCDDRRNNRRPICSTTCVSGCVCNAGYVRSSTIGPCVTEATCPQNTAGTGGQCFGNLVFSQCNANPSCQRSCDNLNGVIACPAICTPGCICRTGYVKRSRFDNQCVSINQCPGVTGGGGGGGLIGGTSGSGGAETIRRAVAVFRGPINGEVFFTQPNLGMPIQVTGTLQGLLANQEHGFHVHELGDLTSGCQSSGDHYNPYRQSHGGRDAQVRHVGDFGNLKADSVGRVNINFSDRLASLNGLNSIIGRALVVHDQRDDLGLGGTAASTISGNAGGRKACAIIGIQEAVRFRKKKEVAGSQDPVPDEKPSQLNPVIIKNA